MTEEERREDYRKLQLLWKEMEAEGIDVAWAIKWISDNAVPIEISEHRKKQ